ncbi:MAG TPA: hypothetical protein VFZ77_19270 [Acidimicrobiales bacterium]
MQPTPTPPAGRRLAARLAAAVALVAALVAPAWGTSGGGAGADVLTAAQSPGAESGEAGGDGTTTSTTAGDTTTSTEGDPTTTSTAHDPTTTVPDPAGDGGTGEPPADPGDGGTGGSDGTDGTDGTGEHGDGPHDPADSFPDHWTPEQVAFAEALIADTEAALERYRNPGILPLLGFTWILDGTQPDGYQHWVNLGWFGDGHELDPAYPESLVFRNTADGPVLEAAMYMLPWGYDLTNIPDDIAWLPGWHVHDNLCFDANGRIVGIAEGGVCETGFLVVTPPMIHVWTVDTPCGRFAGVDEHGLQCHDDH